MEDVKTRKGKVHEILYKGWVSVVRISDEIKGKKVERELVLIKDSVAGIVVDNLGKIALVRQYRPAVGLTLYELPAGVSDKDGLSPEEILLDELYEECGIDENDCVMGGMILKRPYYPMAGCSNTTMSIYYVRYRKVGVDMDVDDKEVERVEWFTQEQIRNMLDQGFILDGKSLIGLERAVR
jgi:8-oxo-dGTP pyrophosphatase MutT (NUDIX family)